MIATAPTTTTTRKRERVALHSLADGADAIDYAALPPGDVRVLSATLDNVQMRLDNVRWALEHYQQLKITLTGELLYLQRRLGVR